jgi:hypothetical protein
MPHNKPISEMSKEEAVSYVKEGKASEEEAKQIRQKYPDAFSNDSSADSGTSKSDLAKAVVQSMKNKASREQEQDQARRMTQAAIRKRARPRRQQ